jgi:hypothetical protein
MCWLAGVDASDDSPTPPMAIDPVKGEAQDIYGTDAWPSIDGVNIWPFLMAPDEYGPIYLRAALWLRNGEIAYVHYLCYTYVH